LQSSNAHRRIKLVNIAGNEQSDSHMHHHFLLTGKIKLSQTLKAGVYYQILVEFNPFLQKGCRLSGSSFRALPAGGRKDRIEGRKLASFHQKTILHPPAFG